MDRVVDAVNLGTANGDLSLWGLFVQADIVVNKVHPAVVEISNTPVPTPAQSQAVTSQLSDVAKAGNR